MEGVFAMAEGNQGGTSADEDEIREKAEKRVSQRMALLEHIASYIIINGFLVIIWALSGRGYPWFLWVMAGWGIGLAFHIVGYFIGKRGEASKDQMIRKEMEKIKREKGM